MKLVYLLLAGLLVGGHVIAQTPDEMTPAEEDVCDTLKGGTPGLYGLCVAYCEAQDLDMTNVDSVDRVESRMALLKNYDRKKRPNDPPMPCLNPDPLDCPCFTYEEAMEVATHEDLLWCGDLREQWFSDSVWIEREIGFLTVGGEIYPDGFPQIVKQAAAQEIYGPPPVLVNCSFYDADLAAGTETWRDWAGLYSDVDDRAKNDACLSNLAQAIEDSGAACESYWYCGPRVEISYPPTVEGTNVTINGALINDPPDECLNDDPIARVEWYWGDGSLDTFYPMPDGYIYLFPNSHVYAASGTYMVWVYLFGSEGQMIVVEDIDVVVP